MIKQVKEANPSQWYSMLKRITNFEQQQQKGMDFQIEEISHLTDKEQAEAIAKSFNAISQEYQEVKIEDIEIPDFPTERIPQLTPNIVQAYINKLKTNKSTVPGDIPAKILKEFSSIFCIPLTDIINSSLKTGIGLTVINKN